MINVNDDTKIRDAPLGFVAKYSSIGFWCTVNHFKFFSMLAVHLFTEFASIMSGYRWRIVFINDSY